MIKPPETWTEEDRAKVQRAIAEHRLSRVDLFYYQALDVEERRLFDIACECLLTVDEVEARVEAARERLRSALERPSQEAYLGRWL